MTIFGKGVSDYFRFVRNGLILIVAVGAARFLVGVSGVAYERATHLVSMTIVTLLIAVFYGQQAKARCFGGYRHLLPIAALLAFSMYGFIILAILVEGLGGIDGYFHAPGAGQAPAGMGLGMHIIGQLIVMVFAIVLLWGLSSLGYLLSRHLGYLRNAFLLLAAMALLRALVAASGVPYAIGTWLTSLTLLGMGLAVYYGYRAPSRGLGRFGHAVLVGVLLASCTALLIVYGIAVTDSLGISTYFHAPGEGFAPSGMSREEHIMGHLQFSVVGMVVLSVLALGGFAFGKRAKQA